MQCRIEFMRPIVLTKMWRLVGCPKSIFFYTYIRLPGHYTIPSACWVHWASTGAEKVILLRLLWLYRVSWWLLCGLYIYWVWNGVHDIEYEFVSVILSMAFVFMILSMKVFMILGMTFIWTILGVTFVLLI